MQFPDIDTVSTLGLLGFCCLLLGTGVWAYVKAKREADRIVRPPVISTEHLK